MKENIKNIIESFISEEKLFPPKTPLLIACSGGPDSMAAVQILKELNYTVGIAHCNFKLRAEADEEQIFVENYAKTNQLPFYTINFETEEFASKSQLSIQESARILRYEWLELIRKQHGFHFVVTAHHKNDTVETVVAHLTKGCGIKGLGGIPVKNDKIVRPLLCIDKQAILEYLADNKLDFKTDASNDSNKYTRNFIRNEVIPKLKAVNPKAVEHLFDLSKKAKEAEFLIQERITQIKRKIVLNARNSQELKFGYVLAHPAGATILYEILKDYNFNSEQSKAIFENLNATSGIEYFSTSHRIIKDRNSLFITEIGLKPASAIEKYLKLPNQIIFNNYKIQVDEGPANEITIKTSKNYAFFDAEKIDFPLTIRFWKSGDYFYPFGLTKQNSDKVGKKKLSKYFKDEKISVLEKENLPVLFSGEKMIWLVGHRIDDRFKVTKETKRVVKMKIVSS